VHARAIRKEHGAWPANGHQTPVVAEVGSLQQRWHMILAFGRADADCSTIPLVDVTHKSSQIAPNC